MVVIQIPGQLQDAEDAYLPGVYLQQQPQPQGAEADAGNLVVSVVLAAAWWCSIC